MGWIFSSRTILFPFVFVGFFFFWVRKMETHHIWNDLWNSASLANWQRTVRRFSSSQAVCLAGGCRAQQQSLLQHHRTSLGFYGWQDPSQAFGGQKSTEPLVHLEFGPLLCSSWEIMLGTSLRAFMHTLLKFSRNKLPFFFFNEKIAVYIHTSSLQILWAKKRLNTFLS